MGEEGNLNLGLSMEEPSVEENLACSLTDIFDILNEDPSSPPVSFYLSLSLLLIAPKCFLLVCYVSF